jgi:hypothetical protein
MDTITKAAWVRVNLMTWIKVAINDKKHFVIQITIHNFVGSEKREFPVLRISKII